MWRDSAILVLLAVSSCAQASGGNGSESGIIRLGTLGGTASTPIDVSMAPTAVVVGAAITSSRAEHAFRWTHAAGMEDLGTLGGVDSRAWAISQDASTIVGEAQTWSGSPRAFRWTSPGGMAMFLGDQSSVALAVSENGRFIVGRIRSETGSSAFRWSQSVGVQLLEGLGGPFSQAEAVTDDGAVLAGSSTSGGQNVNYRAVRWLNGAVQDLGSLGGSESYATGMSADGSVVVGRAVDADGHFRAFRWTQQTGMEDIGDIESQGAIAVDVSADGSVVVGTYFLENNRQRAFRWTRSTGMQSIEDWLRSQGLPASEDVTKTANGVSADGRAVVGTLTDSTGFLAIEQPANSPQSIPAVKLGGLIALAFAVLCSSLFCRRFSASAT